MLKKEITFRFYEELNDFLPVKKKKVSFSYFFSGKSSVKDAIQSLGIPHTEIDLIMANGQSVSPGYHLQHGDYVSVYPVFESLDIKNLSRVRHVPLRESKFILDVHLGKLAKYLRMLGFDTLYDNAFEDDEIIDISCKQSRIILTRDIGILKNNKVTRGYFLRSQDSEEQLKEVLRRFDLFDQIQSFKRCTMCNGIVRKIEKNKIRDRLMPKTMYYYDEFYQCSHCEKIYWKGSHYERMEAFVNKNSAAE